MSCLQRWFLNLLVLACSTVAFAEGQILAPPPSVAGLCSGYLTIRDGTGNQRYAYNAGPYRSKSSTPAFFSGGDGIANFQLNRLFLDAEAAQLVQNLESLKLRGALPTNSLNIFDPHLDAYVGPIIGARLRAYATMILGTLKAQVPPQEAGYLVIEPSQTFIRWTVKSKIENEQFHMDGATAITVLKRELSPGQVPGTRIRDGDSIFSADTKMTIAFNGSQRPGFYGYMTPQSQSVNYDDFTSMSIPVGIRPIVHAAGESPLPITDLLVVVGLTYQRH